MFMSFRATAQWIDAIADAPYFGVDELNSATPINDTQAQLFARLETARLASLQTTTFVAQAAKHYRKLSMIYEGALRERIHGINVRRPVFIEQRRVQFVLLLLGRFVAHGRRVRAGRS